MLPKIAVGVFPNKEDFLQLIDVRESAALIYDGETAKVDELRSWINSSLNILKNRSEYTMIIWCADKLSAECQSVLLKPMEELESQMKMILVAENENGLLPTILSRAEVVNLSKPEDRSDIYWNELRKCWSSGPSACIAFVDSLDKEAAVLVLEEVVRKLKLGLSEEVNSKRLIILDKSVDSLYLLKQTNVNQKLLLDNFFLTCWKVIKS